MKKPIDIPTGLGHLEMVGNLAAVIRGESLKHLAESSADCSMIGTALSAIYQAATCHRKCHGNQHILESLCGRIYNLGVGAYLLTLCGLYDEALNLTRSIGEAANLIALSVVDKKALQEWLASDKQTRLDKFGPGKVRKALKRNGSALLLADDDWYSRFCEAYTHVTPQTRPNVHNAGGQAHAGGIYQPEGFRKTLAELATVLGAVSMIVCEYFKFPDLFQEICALIDSADGKPANSGH
jgi:hypothetical protein